MSSQPIRLYTKGTVLGARRSHVKQYPQWSLIRVEGVVDRSQVKGYLGKRVAFIYRAQKEKNGSKIRVVWGKICKAHGNNGVVRARFTNNLPPKAQGATVRVMLY
eukprot:TRINITY_DN6254_c0_g1_i1.p1 TRINITY_DN6254_c0_g1~~TRINITY_DN6254_c0_g1_i1.p1  ORF type:complete len:122 (+),score=9.86 TRINITY_DN6254_c0_g1_i1:52-366(+)